MAERTVGSLTVTITESCLAAAERGIKIELDDVLNNGVTCFQPNQDIYLRMYTSPESLDVTVKATNGVISTTPGTSTSSHEETVTISDGDGSVSYPIHEVSSIAWFGVAPCPIGQVSYTQGYDKLNCVTCSGSPDGGTLCTVTFGVINISYTAQYRTLVLNVSGAGEVVVYAYTNN